MTRKKRREEEESHTTTSQFGVERSEGRAAELGCQSRCFKVTEEVDLHLWKVQPLPVIFFFCPA